MLWSIAIKPDTEIEGLEDVIRKKPDFVLFMTVQPGKQGGQFITDAFTDAKNFKIDNPDLKIGVDGGVNESTFPQVLRAGIDHIVIGSAIVKADDPKSKYEQFTN